MLMLCGLSTSSCAVPALLKSLRRTTAYLCCLLPFILTSVQGRGLLDPVLGCGTFEELAEVLFLDMIIYVVVSLILSDQYPSHFSAQGLNYFWSSWYGSGFPRDPSLLWLGLLVCVYFQPVGAVFCPHCFGNAASCAYDRTKTCPTIQTVATNAAILVGKAAPTAIMSLVDLITPEYLRILGKVPMNVIQHLALKPRDGTSFEFDADTRVDVLMGALAQGQLSFAALITAYAGFVSDEADDAKRKVLRENFDLLSAAQKANAFSEQSSTDTSCTGLLPWLWGRITHFVTAGPGATAYLVVGAVAVESVSSSSGLAAYSSRLSRFSDEYEFFDALNLMGMFVTALGVCTARIWARMLDRVVWKPLRQHRRSWQFVSELFNIILDRLTDSSGDGVTLDNVYDKSYMNSFFEAAETATRRYYPKAPFFRTVGGNPNANDGDKDKDKDIKDKGKKYNGNFTKTATKCCNAFNLNSAHKPGIHLHPDGTCKFNHVCDHWVSNKGKNGRCLGTEGTPGHSRTNCDNPNKCDSAAQ